MSSSAKFKCWFWNKPTPEWREKVERLLHGQGAFVVLNATSGFQRNSFNNKNEVTLQNHLVKCCRRLKILKNFQTSFFNTKDHFLALQLCLARASKQTNCPVTLSDVMILHKHYVKSSSSNDIREENLTYSIALSLYNEFLKHSNAIDEWTMLDLVKETSLKMQEMNSFFDSNLLIIGIPSNQAHVEILKFLCHEKELHRITLELPLDSSFSVCENDFDIKTESVCFEDIISSENIANDNPIPRQSLTEIYVEDVLRSFLSLLVNNRNELALAKALTSPLVRMNHEGFTALKNIAQERKMPMCQTAISYIRRIELGGKSYAPSNDCPLKDHVKELTEFVAILNRLQDFLEDDSDFRMSLRKILNYLKNCFLKCVELKKIAVETVAERFQILALKDMKMKLVEDESLNNKMIGFKTLLLLRNIEDEICTNQNYANDLSVVSLTEFHLQSQGTPLNVPSVLEFFRTPDVIEPDPEISLRDRVRKKILLPIGQQKLLAGLPWGGVEPLTPKPVLSPLLERGQDLVASEENEVEDNSTHETQTPKRKRVIPQNAKRAILKEVTNKTKSNKRPKTTATKNGKKNTIVKGQQQLTKFFGTQKS